MKNGKKEKYPSIINIGQILKKEYSNTFKELYRTYSAPTFDMGFDKSGNKLVFLNVTTEPLNFEWDMKILDRQGIFKSKRLRKTERIKLKMSGDCYCFNPFIVAKYNRDIKKIKRILFKTYYSADIENKVKYSYTFIFERIKGKFVLQDSKLRVVGWFGIEYPRDDGIFEIDNKFGLFRQKMEKRWGF